MSRRTNRRKFAQKRDSNVLVLDEARKGGGGSGNKAVGNNSQKVNRSMSMAWDQNEGLGIPGTERRNGLMSDWDRKDTLYQAYLGNVWISSAIDVIAKRITSGGFAIEKIKQDMQDNQAQYDAIEQLLLFVNDDEDFLQLVRATITDLCIFGEAYWEVLYKGGRPCQLHKIDCMSMSYHLDQYGNVIDYAQTLEYSQDSIVFQPEEIIRWWFPDPRASKKALSPIERILGATDADGKMADWTRQFFKKGAKPPFYVELAEDSDIDEANRFIKWFKENYTGLANSHVPPVMYNGAKLVPFTGSSVDVDFMGGRKMNREEVLAGFLVPPATVGIIESGNIGGGTGESQDKALQYNACDPIKQIFFEKFNYRIIQKGFGIDTYRVSTRYADYRGDDQISKIQDIRIRNGSLAVNEVRAEMGKTPAKGGDANVIVTTKEIIPVERFDDFADEQRQTAAATLDKLVNPPPPPPTPPQLQVQKAENTDDEEDDGNAPTVKMAAIKKPAPKAAGNPFPKKAAPKKEEAAWRYWLREAANHDGVMVALFPSSDCSNRLALPGYEPATDLHLTLAYLGSEDELYPGDTQKLIDCLTAFAAGAEPLSGLVSGIGKFSSGIDGQPDPFYASADVPGLPSWREDLIDMLTRNDFPVHQEHGFTPHITLAYLDRGEPLPISVAPMLPLDFQEVWLSIGGARYVFPIGRAQESSLDNLFSIEEDRSLSPIRLPSRITIQESDSGHPLLFLEGFDDEDGDEGA